jgi:hypothetical protein
MTEHTSFLFTELANNALTDGRAFDGVAFGTFTDMYGREITLDAKDAAKFAANTQLAIEATRAESGELVGLPIDAEGHDKGDGAGWIVGAELVEGVIRLLPKWTEIGRDLISKGIRRFFSATIDTSNKVVLGGTLTNWPATRDENNRLMLRPIELAADVFAIDTERTVTESGTAAAAQGEKIMPDEITELEQEEVAEAVAPEPQAVATAAEAPTPPPATEPAESPLQLPPDQAAELMREFAEAAGQEPIELLNKVQKWSEQIANNRLEELLEKREQDWAITQLAADLTGRGTYGLPVGIVELASFLESLGPAQFEAAERIFKTISKNGVVDFQERGHSHRLRKKQLPTEYHSHLRDTIAAGNTIAEFFEATGLGKSSDYDLSMFQEVK